MIDTKCRATVSQQSAAAQLVHREAARGHGWQHHVAAAHQLSQCLYADSVDLPMQDSSYECLSYQRVILYVLSEVAHQATLGLLTHAPRRGAKPRASTTHRLKPRQATVSRL